MTGMLPLKTNVFWTDELGAEFLVWKLSEQYNFHLDMQFD